MSPVPQVIIAGVMASLIASLTASLFTGLPLGQAHADTGRLVIAGGALSADNAEVHGAFLAGLGDDSRIAIIPAASAEPVRSARAYSDTLTAHGVSPTRIDIIRLAVIDDPSTPETDESAWAGNAGDPDEIAHIAAADAIWFTGGDQMRITQALLRPDGAPTAMLTALRARLAAGAALGGSSAGAAIMGRLMIARGDSLTALTQPLLTGGEAADVIEGGQLLVSAGLGFLPLGLPDQHVDRQARLGRLVRALFELPPEQRIGFGVEEDTALIIEPGARDGFAAGAGRVIVVDARQARLSDHDGRAAITGVRLSLIGAGDRISLADLTIRPAPQRTPIDPAGGDYDDVPRSGAGIALPQDTLADMLGRALVDNRSGQRLEAVSFGADGAGVRFVFEKTPASRGAYSEETGYTLSSLSLAIEPVDVSVRAIAR